MSNVRGQMAANCRQRMKVWCQMKILASRRSAHRHIFAEVIVISALISAAPPNAKADEGGVSMWLPGLFGSLAAVPQQQPGWSGMTTYYHTSVSAGADVARAREITIGNLPVNVTATVNANLKANVDVGLFVANYAFATPVFGGQASVGLMGLYGRNSTSLNGTLTGTIALPGGAVIPFAAPTTSAIQCRVSVICFPSSPCVGMRVSTTT